MREATPQNSGFEPENRLENSQNSVENRLFDLQNRVFALENDRERFLKALRGAVEMLLENPMATAMMPKQMKEDLRRYIKDPN